jgi:hypothetical protein
LPLARRDLAKLGIIEPDQLEQTLPEGIRCRIKVALRKDDDGSERNRVVTFTVTAVDGVPEDAKNSSCQEVKGLPS